MDLQEFIKAKRELQLNLMRVIQAEVEKFEEATGLSPNSISVHGGRADSFAIGSLRQKYYVGNVIVEVPIE